MSAGVVLYLLPVVGAGLVVSGRHRVGTGVVFVAGVAGFAFEGVFHFVLANPDHVAHVASHGTAFGLTALLTTGSDLSLVVVPCAPWLVGRSRCERGSLEEM